MHILTRQSSQQMEIIKSVSACEPNSRQLSNLDRPYPDLYLCHGPKRHRAVHKKGTDISVPSNKHNMLVLHIQLCNQICIYLHKFTAAPSRQHHDSTCCGQYASIETSIHPLLSNLVQTLLTSFAYYKVILVSEELRSLQALHRFVYCIQNA